jgi:hypothetical protein
LFGFNARSPSGAPSVLGDRATHIVPSHINIHETVTNSEQIAKTGVATFQSSSIARSELVRPQPDGFITADTTALSEQIFNISITEFESMTEPGSILNNSEWKLLSFVSYCRSAYPNTTV